MPLQDFLTGTNAGYAGIGLIIVVFILWRLFSKGGGRLGLERQEERETNELKKDELIIEATQRDEKKNCSILERAFYDLLTFAGTVDNQINIRTKNSADIIFLMLKRFREESMGVEQALENFKSFHNSVNEFLALLPRGNQEINRLVSVILNYQEKYYKDLIKELNMDRLKQARLQKLWRQSVNEMRGSGNVKAA